MNEMFKREDTPTIMSGLVVRYKITSAPYDGEINASRDGVGIAGRFPIMDVERCAVFEEYVMRARYHALHLRQDYDRLFGPYIKALTEEEVDHLLAPMPFYEAAE